ncbi:hypothetical protein CYMTET_27757 [Cymbomonas tetramitiformis]|uniref:Sulfotransferase n=1 Tax=Cymbomonas tetramitiformis TaxID=36881 RepID=A0AAE0FP84_9CHLO|nr:hypothetical protein CYMTET_27757 [Cymbomonas tetramitiformis]
MCMCVFSDLARSDDLLTEDRVDTINDSKNFRISPEHVARYTTCKPLPTIRRVIYNRVPKAGSTTWLRLIDRQATLRNFNHVNIGWTATDWKDDGGAAILRRTVRVVRGRNRGNGRWLSSQHSLWLNFSRIGVPQPAYINVLRDPVQRYTSSYYYNRYGPRPKARRENFLRDHGSQNINECVRATGAKPPYFDETLMHTWPSCVSGGCVLASLLCQLHHQCVLWKCLLGSRPDLHGAEVMAMTSARGTSVTASDWLVTAHAPSFGRTFVWVKGMIKGIRESGIGKRVFTTAFEERVSRLGSVELAALGKAPN